MRHLAFRPRGFPELHLKAAQHFDDSNDSISCQSSRTILNAWNASVGEVVRASFLGSLSLIGRNWSDKGGGGFEAQRRSEGGVICPHQRVALPEANETRALSPGLFSLEKHVRPERLCHLCSLPKEIVSSLFMAGGDSPLPRGNIKLPFALWNNNRNSKLSLGMQKLQTTP